MRFIRPRLTYANVVASLALFVALGGIGWAASTLPRDSVGQRELKSGAVGEKELRAGAIPNAHTATAKPVLVKAADGRRVVLSQSIKTQRETNQFVASQVTVRNDGTERVTVRLKGFENGDPEPYSTVQTLDPAERATYVLALVCNGMPAGTNKYDIKLDVSGGAVTATDRSLQVFALPS